MSIEKQTKGAPYTAEQDVEKPNIEQNTILSTAPRTALNTTSSTGPSKSRPEAGMHDEIIRRIESITGTRTQAGLAAALGIKQSSISDAKRRGTIPAEWYLRLFESFGANPDWLKKEQGPRFLRTANGYSSAESCHEQNYGAVVTAYSPSCDAHTVAAGPQLEPCCLLTVPLRYAHPGLLVLCTFSDACAPLIRKGAYVGVDTRQTHPQSGELFAVLMPHEGIVLRRLYFLEHEQSFALRCENKAYPESRLAPKDCSHRMIGRLGWVMQKF